MTLRIGTMHEDLKIKLSEQVERSLDTMRVDQTRIQEIEMNLKNMSYAPTKLREHSKAIVDIQKQFNE